MVHAINANWAVPRAQTARVFSTLRILCLLKTQKSLWGLCFVAVAFEKVSFTVTIWSLLGVTKSCSLELQQTPLGCCFGHPQQSPSQWSGKMLRGEVFNAIWCFPLLISVGWSWRQVKYIDMPSALQSIRTRASAGPDSPAGHPSAFPSNTICFPTEEGKLLLLQAWELLTSTWYSICVCSCSP